MNNKKGFTLVELLAVIVILALIMSIAIISIGGVLDSAKTSTFKETAASIIDGVKKQLLINNALTDGDYYFSKGVLDRGGSESPFGGTLTIPDTLSTASGGNCAGGTLIGTNICRLASAVSNCTATTTPSYIRISNSGKTASICLTAGSGNKFINLGTETALLSNDDTMID